MLLFRVDKVNLEIKYDDSPLNHITKHSVTINDKRRDRVTDKYHWFDDIDDAFECLKKAVKDKKTEIEIQANQLLRQASSLDALYDNQVKQTRGVLTQYNNDGFFD